jgi:hypothetical protein
MPSKKGQRKRRPLNIEDERIQKVLALVFEGRFSRAKIAEDCGVPLRTCEDWIAHPDFQTTLEGMRADILKTSDTLRVAYVRKEQRIIGFSQMAESARLQYEERPLLTERRQIGYDKEAKQPLFLDNEAFNRDAHAAFRECLKEIADELGDRKQKVELTGKDGINLTTDAGLALAASLLPHLANSEAREALATVLLQEANANAASQPR